MLCTAILWIAPAAAIADFANAQLLASDGAPDADFGRSVSTFGDTILIGAHQDDDNGLGSGAAYVFRFDGANWVEEQKLTASDAAANDRFGTWVSIFEDTALIGADGDDDDGVESGSAYVFRFDGSIWLEEQKLTASDASFSDNFGHSVSLSGDKALIGAEGADDNRGGFGAAYVFRFDGTSWVEEQKLVASDDTPSFFAFSVSISGDTALVGAFGDDLNINHAALIGSAYVFRFDGANWVEEQKIPSPSLLDFHFFGGSVSISDDTALIGAYGSGSSTFVGGQAYVFRFDGSDWAEEQRLESPGASYLDGFGGSVSISGDTARIGTVGDDDSFGSAYVFRFDGTDWMETRKLTAYNRTETDGFVGSVSLSDVQAVVGARSTNNGAGAAYVFDDPALVPYLWPAGTALLLSLLGLTGYRKI
jgi:hypothetical protein